MKVLLNDGLSQNGLEIFEKAGIKYDKNHYEGDELLEKIKHFDGILVRSATTVTKEIIDAGINLKAIARAGTGIDNIDHVYAASKGIPVLNTPGANSASVSELVFGHFFNLARYISESKRTMALGEWNKNQYKGYELAGKTLGVVGFGRIGKITAGIGLALGMKVLAYDVMNINSDMNVKVVSKEQLLNESDFISIHVPKLDKPFIGTEELKMMKKSAFLVNCSRGGVVDETALLEALNNGIIAGAGLDVWENEPHPNSVLVKHPKVSATCHIGANTYDALDRVGIEIAEKMVAELMK
ncbi:MAG: D-2-hydroxyacid dehydrogenase [Candidatus Marinimicrobia bacterium]|nr:D-2-hydroxyacid dehydrogenase [Candidatus Neomarinimicrobiota bacterium]